MCVISHFEVLHTLLSADYMYLWCRTCLQRWRAKFERGEARKLQYGGRLIYSQSAVKPPAVPSEGVSMCCKFGARSETSALAALWPFEREKPPAKGQKNTDFRRSH